MIEESARPGSGPGRGGRRRRHPEHETAPERVIAGLAGGAVAYLVKPVDPELLEQELQWALDDARGAHAAADGDPRRAR